MVSASSSAPGLSFCGGALLGAYHIGAYKAISQRAPLWVRSVSVAGSSAGSLVGAGVVCGVEPDHLTAALDGITEHVQRQVFGMLTPWSEDLLDVVRLHCEELLPQDAHTICSGRLHVAVTKLQWPRPVGELVSDFKTRDDLLDTLCASSFVPGITASMMKIPRLPAAGGHTTPAAKHHPPPPLTVDGGLTQNWPRLPSKCGPTVFVSPFSGAFNICPQNPPSARTLPFQDARVCVSGGNIRSAVHGLWPPSGGMSQYELQGFMDATSFLEPADHAEGPDCALRDAVFAFEAAAAAEAVP